MSQINNNRNEHINQSKLFINLKTWEYGFLGRAPGRIWRNQRRFRSI